MTEELIGRVSRIHDLRVSSRTSVTRFKDTQLAVPEIAKILGVDAIVEGSVIREGNRIRVHAQLIRGATDDHFWSEAYDRQIRDVLTLESEVTQAIADQVRIQLTTEQQAHLRSTGKVNPEAYNAYLRGRFLLQTPTLQANNNAKRYFQEAIQKDSTFALAYAGLADCYLDSGAYRWVRPQDAYRPGKEAIQKATRLDDTLSEVHSSIGYLQWQYDWDWQAAEKEIRYALELNPNNMDARDGLIWFLAWSGRGTEALEELGKLRISDPAYPLAALDESGVYYHARNYKGLMEASQKALSADPNNWTGHYFLAVSYDGLNRHADAIPKYQRAVELAADQTDAVAGLAHAYALAGERAETAKILRQLQERSKASYVSPYMLATIFTALGDKNQAFTFLEEAYQQRSPDIAYFLRADLRLDPLRGDPRFADLLRRVGLN
jgi:tetratricopeptide (TPR) repeat protein